MDIFDGFSKVFELASKEFYAPLFADRKRRRKLKNAEPVRPERQLATYRRYLQQLRRQAGIRQQTMASAMNTTQSVISRFESGWGNPTLGFLNRYCETINIGISIAFREKSKKSV